MILREIKENCVCECGNFCVTQIFREINFRKFKNTKIVILTHLKALNLNFYGFLDFREAEIYSNEKFRARKIAKTPDF